MTPYIPIGSDIKISAFSGKTMSSTLPLTIYNGKKSNKLQNEG